MVSFAYHGFYLKTSATFPPKLTHISHCTGASPSAEGAALVRHAGSNESRSHEVRSAGVLDGHGEGLDILRAVDDPEVVAQPLHGRRAASSPCDGFRMTRSRS